MIKLCPFRKEIKKEETISLTVTATNIKTDFSLCYGKDCPYYTHDGANLYCIKVINEFNETAK